MAKKNAASIKWELTFFIVVLMALVIGILSFFILDAQKKSLTNEVKLRGLSIAKNLANSVADFILTDDELSIAKLMSETMNNKGIKYALVVDKKGMIRTHNNIELMGEEYKEPKAEAVLEKSKTSAIIVYTDSKEGKIMDFGVPVIAKGRVRLGTVRLGMSYSLIDDVINAAYVRILVISIAAIIFGVLGAFLLGAAITKPVEILAKGAKIIGKGNLEHRIKVKSKNEIGTLANVLNMMTVDLKHSQEMAIQQQRLAKELEVAKEIQLSLIPKEIAEVPGYEVAAYYEAAKEVGGDYYDVVQLPEGKTGLVMGDVSGKGIPAALIMAMARSVLHSQAPVYASSDCIETIKSLNSTIYKDIREGMFITVFYGILDITAHTLNLSSAGHNDTLIYKAGEKNVVPYNPKGFAIGMDPGQRFNKIVKSETVALETGDAVVLFTDGITEAMNEKKEEYEDARLMDVIMKNGAKTAEQLKDEIIKSVKEFVNGYEQSDDIALLVIKKIK